MGTEEDRRPSVIYVEGEPYLVDAEDTNLMPGDLAVVVSKCGKLAISTPTIILTKDKFGGRRWAVEEVDAGYEPCLVIGRVVDRTFQ